MDRQIFYSSEVVLDTDLLNLSKNPMVGLGYALQDILGAGTLVAGFPCTQTTVASLAVLVGPGRIYSLQNVDNTAYGSLPPDTTDQIVKQGIQQGFITLATPAPATAGQSINYLIEASYQDVDTTAAVLPFYNSANPQVPFSGESNNGAPLPTQRKGTAVVQVKPGIPATTGSQTTPAPDAGFVGLFVVTVANGQTSVMSTNITQVPGAPLISAFVPFLANGLVTIPAPVSSNNFSTTGLGTLNVVGGSGTNMVAISATGSPGGEAAVFKGSATGASIGVDIQAGLSSTDRALAVFSLSGTTPYLNVFGDGGTVIGSGISPGLGALLVSPSGGVGLTVNQATDFATIQAKLSGNTSGESYLLGTQGSFGSTHNLTTAGVAQWISVGTGATLGIGVNQATDLNIAANHFVTLGTAQSTGWGTPTGAAVTSSFAGASATLAQTSAVVAELITVLKSFGLLGA